MTTYLLLALTDDGRVSATYCPPARGRLIFDDATEEGATDMVTPTRTGDDRNAYSVYEIAGYSIDVVRLPE